MKLYEIMADMERLCDPYQPFDETALEVLHGELSKKTDSIGGLLRSLSADIESIRFEEKRLAERRTALENRQKDIKDYVLYQMEAHSLDKYKGQLFTLSRHKSPPSLVIDCPVEDLPPEYITVIPQRFEANKDKIKEALKNGKEIKDCHLRTSEHLRLR